MELRCTSPLTATPQTLPRHGAQPPGAVRRHLQCTGATRSARGTRRWFSEWGCQSGSRCRQGRSRNLPSCHRVLVPWAVHLRSQPVSSPQPPGPRPDSRGREHRPPGRFASLSLGKVDGQVPIAMSEGIGVVVDGRLEARTLEPGDRTSHIGDLEDWFETGDQPLPRHELELAISLPIQPAEAVVADWHVGV